MICRRKGSTGFCTCCVSGCSKPAFTKGYCADQWRTFVNGTADQKQTGLCDDLSPAFSTLKLAGLDIMILLTTINEDAIVQNLNFRFKNDIIYTRIRDV
jgi:myosin heavy subunit